jgi:hypothetical protein
LADVVITKKSWKNSPRAHFGLMEPTLIPTYYAKRLPYGRGRGVEGGGGGGGWREGGGGGGGRGRGEKLSGVVERHAIPAN